MKETEEIKKKITWDKILQNIARPKDTYFYLFIIIGMTLIPYFIRPGLPVPVSPETEKWYETLNALGPDDTIIFTWEEAPSTMLIEYDFVVPTWIHLMQKPGLKIIFITLRQATALQTFEETCNGQYGSGGLWSKKDKYGIEYVYLGFLPGLDAAAAALAKDIWSACGGRDRYGNSLSSLPMMANIHDYHNIKLIIETGNVEEGPWMRQWTIPYGTILCELTSSEAYAWLLPYYESGLITAMLSGVKGAAEYEYLLKMPGHAIGMMDVMSIGGLIFLCGIVVSNISYQILRQQKKVRE